MLRALALCCACLLAAPAAAFAEWHITPMIGLTFAGKTTITDLDQGTGKVHPNLSVSGACSVAACSASRGSRRDTRILSEPGTNRDSSCREQSLVESSRLPR